MIGTEKKKTKWESLSEWESENQTVNQYILYMCIHKMYALSLSYIYYECALSVFFFHSVFSLARIVVKFQEKKIRDAAVSRFVSFNSIIIVVLPASYFSYLKWNAHTNTHAYTSNGSQRYICGIWIAYKHAIISSSFSISLLYVIFHE